jgi:hypothetical protein
LLLLSLFLQIIFNKASWRGISVAVKRYDLNGQLQGRILAEWKREAELMRKIKFDRVLQLVAVSEEPYAIVMQWMEGGI